MHQLRSALIALSALAVPGCGDDNWEGYAYLEKADLAKSQNLGRFESLEQCRAAARSFLSSRGAALTGDYECGRNCATRDGFGDLRVCKETSR